jgi:hypothetical protein
MYVPSENNYKVSGFNPLQYTNDLKMKFLPDVMMVS